MKCMIIRANGENETRNHGKPPLAFIQAAVGGYIELVPHFSSFEDEDEGRICRAAAYCNEEGKLRGLPINIEATILWYGALARDGISPPDDVLVGDVIVLYGTAEEIALL